MFSLKWELEIKFQTEKEKSLGNYIMPNSKCFVPQILVWKMYYIYIMYIIYNMYNTIFIFLFLRFYLFILRVGKGERKRRREISICGCLTHPLLGTWPETQACSLDWELNQWPFDLQAGVQSTEPHQPGPYIYIYTYTYIHTYIYIYTHTHTHTHIFLN